MEWLLCELCKAGDESELYRSAQYWQSRFEFEEPWGEDDFFTVFYALSITPGLLHEREIQMFFDDIIGMVLDAHANDKYAHSLFSFIFRGLAGAMSKVYLLFSKEIVNFIKVLVTYFFKGTITSNKTIQFPQNNYTIQEFFNMYEPILTNNIHIAGFTLEIEGTLYPFVWQNFLRIVSPSDTNDFLFRMQSKPDHIVSVEKWLTKLNIDQICQVCYKLPLDSENMYAVLRFLKDWNPISSFHQACRDDFIRSVPLIFAQIVMAHKACWWDSDTSACATCKINWRHFLPQWRCTAMWCESGNTRCFRFLQPGTLFCKQHFEEKEKRFSAVAKPYCLSNVPGREIITRDMYTQEPHPAGDAIVRYGLTQRVVTSLGIFSHRRDTWKPNGFYLPVTRYESLYYSTQDETQKTDSRRYCGKFFFFEPESPYFLRLDKCVFFATKIEAFLKLKEQYDLFHASSRRVTTTTMDAKQFVLDLQKQSSLFYFRINPQNNTDWFNFHFMTPIFDFRDTRNAEFNINIPILYPSETITRDGTSVLGGQGVGDFDDLDQEICKMARDLDYDVLIFQHEIGGHDCVTEFLVTNPAKEILYVMEDVPTTLYLQKANDVYPKIWFPKQNGIVRVVDNKAKEIELGNNWERLLFLFPFPIFTALPSSLPQATDRKSQAPRFVHIKRPFYTHFKERRSTETEPPEEEEEFEKFL